MGLGGGGGCRSPQRDIHFTSCGKTKRQCFPQQRNKIVISLAENNCRDTNDTSFCPSRIFLLPLSLSVSVSVSLSLSLILRLKLALTVVVATKKFHSISCPVFHKYAHTYTHNSNHIPVKSTQPISQNTPSQSPSATRPNHIKLIHTVTNLPDVRGRGAPVNRKCQARFLSFEPPPLPPTKTEPIKLQSSHPGLPATPFTNGASSICRGRQNAFFHLKAHNNSTLRTT